MLRFPACLCRRRCRDDLIVGLSWTAHCLVFLHTISRPRYAVPWGFLSIRFFGLFFPPRNLLFTFL